MHHGTNPLVASLRRPGPRAKRTLKLEFQHEVATAIAMRAGATNKQECAAFWGLSPHTWTRLKNPERFGTSGEVAAAVLHTQPILFSQVIKPVMVQ